MREFSRREVEYDRLGPASPGRRPQRDIETPARPDRAAQLLADGSCGILVHATPSIVANAFSESGRRAIQRAKGLPPGDIRTNVLAVPCRRLAHFVRIEAHHPLIQPLLRRPETLTVGGGGAMYNVVASDLLLPYRHLVRHRGPGVGTAVICPMDDQRLEPLYELASARIRGPHHASTAAEVFAIQGSSANRHGQPQPRTLAEVDRDILDEAGFILDATQPGSASAGQLAIADLTGGLVDSPGRDYGLIRPGAFPLPPRVEELLHALRERAGGNPAATGFPRRDWHAQPSPSSEGRSRL